MVEKICLLIITDSFNSFLLLAQVRSFATFRSILVKIISDELHKSGGEHQSFFTVYVQDFSALDGSLTKQYTECHLRKMILMFQSWH